MTYFEKLSPEETAHSNAIWEKYISKREEGVEVALEMFLTADDIDFCHIFCRSKLSYKNSGEWIDYIFGEDKSRTDELFKRASANLKNGNLSPWGE